MNTQFNSASSCTPKKLAKQLMVDAAKLLNNKQRQDLLDIFIALDIAEKTSQHTYSQENIEAESSIQQTSQEVEYDNEYNQEYWSGQHCDSYNLDYPQDWLRRIQQHPQRLSNPKF